MAPWVLDQTHPFFRIISGEIVTMFNQVHMNNKISFQLEMIAEYYKTTSDCVGHINTMQHPLCLAKCGIAHTQI
jgi:hypothetical protein